MNLRRSTTYYALLSGVCAATGSLCGKMCGLPIFQGYLVVFRAIFFALMITFNSGVLTLYVKALQASGSSLSATVLSAASNYFFSALIGITLFSELTSATWWAGMALILLGLIFIARDSTSNSINNESVIYKSK